MKSIHVILGLGLTSLATFALGCSGAASAGDTASTESSEGALLAGPLLSESAVAGLLRGAGFEESVVGKMVCTAKYESGWYQDASHKNSNGTTDYGIWQINSIHLGAGGCASSGTAAYVGATNARCAKEIYDDQGISAWYAYTSHKSTCDSYRAPPATSSGGDDDSGDDDSSGGGGSSSGSSSGSGSTSGSGSCWSATLGETVSALSCVYSQYDSTEEQCVDGDWYSGVSDGAGQGGECTSMQ